MVSTGKLRNDQIRYVLSLDIKGVDSPLKTITAETQKYTDANTKLISEIKALEQQIYSAQDRLDAYTKANMVGSNAYKKQENIIENARLEIDKHTLSLEANNKAIAENEKKISEIVKAYNIEDLTMSQLKQSAKDLEKQLENTSKARSPEAYRQLEKEIADVKSRMDELKKGMDDTTRTMKIGDMTMNQLRQKAKELEDQLNNTSKSADPEAYRKLQSELSSTRGRMSELEKEGKNTDNIFAQFTTGVNKYWAAIVAGYKTAEGVFNAWKDLMTSNRATGIEFEATMNGVNEALDYAKTAFATMDFTNFIEGMVRSYEAGKAASKMLDELFDRQNSFDLTTAPVKAEIEELKTQMRDVNLSYEERIKLANRIIGLTNGMAEQQKEIIAQEVAANEKRLDGQLAMTAAEKEYVIFNYNQNIESIRYAKQVIELEKARDAVKRNALSFADKFEKAQHLKRISELDEQIDLLKKSTEFSDIAYSSMQKYLLGSKELVQGYVDAQKKALGVDIQTNKELRMTERLKNTMIKSNKKSGETAEQKQQQKERKELSKINEDLEIAHKEKLTKINLDYLSGELKTEADFNRQSFAQEQAYYVLREKSLKDFVDRAKNEEIKRDASKQLAAVQEKMLSQQVKYQKELEKIILNADPVKKEKQAYDERLDALGLYGETAQSLQEKIATAQTEEEKQQLQQKYDAFLLLEKQYQDNLDKIKKAGKAKEKADAEAVFQESFKQRKEEMQQELNDLMAAAESQSGGTAAFNAEMEVHKQKLLMIQEETAARKAAGLETTKQLTEQGKIEAQMSGTIRKELEKRTKQFQQYGNTVGQALGNVMTGQEDALQAFGDASIDIVFDILSQIIEAEIIKVMASSTSSIMRATAEAMSTPQSALSGGAAGFATAAILVGAITAATMAAKTALKGLQGKKKGSSSSSSKSDSGKSSGTMTVKQKGYAEGGQHLIGGYTGTGGKYDIKGIFPDGEPYHAGEYIIPKEEMKVPWVQEMVRNIDSTRVKRTKKNPLPAGFAEGGGHDIDPADMMAFAMNSGLMSRFIEVMERLDKKEFKTYLGLTEYQSKLEEMNKEDNRFKKK